MADYKAMYYYLAGRTACTIDALEATTKALSEISEKLKNAQQVTEEIFINAGEDEVIEFDFIKKDK